jgi:hypothetical protein
MFILVILFVFISCSDSGNPIKTTEVVGSGRLVSQMRSLPAVHSIDMTAVGDVRVALGSHQMVTVRVDDNVIDHITTTVVNGHLIIGTEPNVSISEYDLTVTATITDCRQIELTGVGNIVSTNSFTVDSLAIALTGVGNIEFELQADYLNTTNAGVGNIVYNGEANRHIIAHTAVGNINSFGLISDTTIIYHGGVGGSEVYVEDYLNVTINGVGSVYYRGAPVIEANIIGSGQLRDANF